MHIRTIYRGVVSGCSAGRGRKHTAAQAEWPATLRHGAVDPGMFRKHLFLERLAKGAFAPYHSGFCTATQKG